MAGTNVETVAKALNITPRRVQQLVKDGMPKGERGEYDLGACMVWYIRYLQKTGAMPEGVSDPEKLDPFRRRAFYQGEIEKLRLESEMGDLIPRIEVEQGHARVMKVVAQMLETLPDVIERDCGVSGDVVQIIERRIDALRRAMHSEMTQDNAGIVIRKRARRKAASRRNAAPAKAAAAKRRSGAVSTQ